MTQAALPLPPMPATPPRLPEPREYEPASDYLHRCLALADRYWREWRERRGEERGT